MFKLRDSYVHGSSDLPLIGKTIGRQFDETAETFPDREALVVCHQNIRWTYSELKQEVDNLAAGLLTLGLNVGDQELGELFLMSSQNTNS